MWLTLAPLAEAQESFFTDAATLPAPGKVIARTSVAYRSFGRDESGLGRRGYSVMSNNSLQLGLAPELSLTLDVPVSYRDYTQNPVAGAPDHIHSNPPSTPNADPTASRITDTVVDDFTLIAKWRFWRSDTGPLDTTRLALLLGAEFPAGSTHSSDSVDPIAGIALTAIRKRHGYNLSATYKLSLNGESYPLFPGEGTADLLRVASSYLYRLSPAQFSTTETTGIYAVMESVTFYETSGDFESLISPGLLLEAPGVAAELAVQVPVYQQVTNRPQTDFVIALGLRFTW